MKEKQFNKIGCVVLDEIHMMGDANRGYILELLLAKILHWSDNFVKKIVE